MTSDICMKIWAVNMFFFNVLWNLILYSCFDIDKKIISKKLDPNVYVISSNIESEDPVKND